MLLLPRFHKLTCLISCLLFLFHSLCLADFFVEDFSDNSPSPRLQLGVGFGSPATDFSQDFTITSGSQNRIYLGTLETDYIAESFDFEAVVTFSSSPNDWSNVFFGIGDADAVTNGSFGEPVTTGKNLIMTVWPDPNRLRISSKDNGTTTASVLQTADGALPNLIGNTHKLRLRWDGFRQTALFEFDELNDGSVEVEFTLDGSDNAFGTGQSPLFIGGGNMTSFDDIQVVNQDADNDQLYDPWERQFFGDLTSTDGTGDADLDGVSDADEFAAGTDPQVAQELTGQVASANITVTASSEFAAGFEDDKLIDGMTQEGTRQHLNTHWSSAEAVLAATIDFEFTPPINLSHLEILNSSNSGWNDSDVESFTIATSQDGVNFSSESSSISLQSFFSGLQRVDFPASTPTDGIQTLRLNVVTGSTKRRLSLNEVKVFERINPDLDSDGLTDVWEMLHFGDLSHGPTTDEEPDGLTNLQEFTTGTNPTNSDTDSDLLTDSHEVNTSLTDPLKDDTDGDGLRDGVEVLTHLTDPLLVDTDQDGASDGLEVLHGYEPTIITSSPPASFTLNGAPNPGTIAPYLDGVLPVLRPASGSGTQWNLVEALPNLSFESLKGLVVEPRSNNLHVVERRGTVQRVDYDAATTSKTLFFDISSRVDQTLNAGLRTVVFHPEFNDATSPNKDYLYAFYSTRATAGNGFSQNTNNKPFLRLSRFTRNPTTGVVDTSSELVMIQQSTPEAGAHFGGGLVFGLDGFLYVSFGDLEFRESDTGTPFYQDSQRLDRIFQSAILCIDVDRQGGTVSSRPTRTLHGGSIEGFGTDQSVFSGHAYYHEDNLSGIGYYIPRSNYWHKDNNTPVSGTAVTASTSFQGGTVNISVPVHGDALEEHVAIGIRNPWRMALDPVDGDIFWFSVGGNIEPDFDEVERLVQGGNYGWPYREGTISKAFETNRSKPPLNTSGQPSLAPAYQGIETDPIYAYNQSNAARSTVVGGVLYTGAQFSSLNRKLIFADHESGRIWSMEYKGLSTPVVTELAQVNYDTRQMSSDPSGEDVLFAADGKIWKLIDSSPPSPEPPATLSATGFFTNLGQLQPRAGAIYYKPTAPLWSDRASKVRYVALPNSAGVSGEYDLASEKITFSENDGYVYPQGSVFVKHFSIPLDARDPENPSLQHKVETRFMVYGEANQWYAFSYKWRDDQSDADLVPDGLLDPSFAKNVSYVDESGNQATQTWTYPTRNECFDCHQQSYGSVLGFRTRQLNETITYPGGSQSNQLATFRSLAVFDDPPSVDEMMAFITSAKINDPGVDLEHRVRSYLDSNCANCHHPGGSAGQASFDARLTTPLAQSGLINGVPGAGDFGLFDPRLIIPGDPERSIIYVRDAALDPQVMMPPVGRSLNDEPYLVQLRSWIERIGAPNFDSFARANGVMGGLHDDQDRDGMVNGLEFLLGKDPMVSGVGTGIFFDTMIDGTLRYNIPLNGRALADGLDVEVESSLNLVDWFNMGHVESRLTPGSDTSGMNVDGVRSLHFLPGARGFVRVGLPTNE